MPLEFLYRLLWIYRWRGSINSLIILILLIHVHGNIFICFCLQFLSSKYCSFHCTDLSPLQLNLFLSILLLVMLLWMWYFYLFFWIFCHYCTENTTDFCIFALYPENLLNLLINSDRLLVESRVFYIWDHIIHK